MAPRPGLRERARPTLGPPVHRPRGRTPARSQPGRRKRAGLALRAGAGIGRHHSDRAALGSRGSAPRCPPAPPERRSDQAGSSNGFPAHPRIPERAAPLGSAAPTFTSGATACNRAALEASSSIRNRSPLEPGPTSAPGTRSSATRISCSCGPGSWGGYDRSPWIRPPQIPSASQRWMMSSRPSW